MSDVTYKTITMRQVLEIYWNTTDAMVARAAMCVLHGLPMIGSFQEPTEHERDAAAATVAGAWNTRAAARKG